MTNLPFNDWSKERIKQGRKSCTTRIKEYGDNRVDYILYVPLWFVKRHLWKLEGADSPEEFEKVWNEIHPMKRYSPGQLVYVHFGDFKDD